MAGNVQELRSKVLLSNKTKDILLYFIVFVFFQHTFSFQCSNSLSLFQFHVRSDWLNWPKMWRLHVSAAFSFIEIISFLWLKSFLFFSWTWKSAEPVMWSIWRHMNLRTLKERSISLCLWSQEDESLSHLLKSDNRRRNVRLKNFPVAFRRPELIPENPFILKRHRRKWKSKQSPEIVNPNVDLRTRRRSFTTQKYSIT